MVDRLSSLYFQKNCHEGLLQITNLNIISDNKKKE